MNEIVNHEEAEQFAMLKMEESNLARCYLDSRFLLSEIREAWLALIGKAAVSIEAHDEFVTLTNLFSGIARKRVTDSFCEHSWNSPDNATRYCQRCGLTRGGA